jgi:hypothetical protein
MASAPAGSAAPRGREFGSVWRGTGDPRNEVAPDVMLKRLLWWLLIVGIVLLTAWLDPRTTFDGLCPAQVGIAVRYEVCK